jgi:hypothetical protein
MKLSKLRSLCDKAIEKYGDMDLGVFSSCDSREINDGSEAYQGLSFRIIRDQELPGESVDEEDQPTEPPFYHAILFYD